MVHIMSIGEPTATNDPAADHQGTVRGNGALNEEHDTRLTEASRIISSSTAWSAATGAIPVPLLDVAALAAMQASMIGKIAALYGETLGSQAARSIVSVLLGTLLPAGLAVGVMRSTIKLVPGAGYIIGTASMMGLSAAATYAIGKVFVNHFEGGGTLANFSPEAVKADLKREYEGARARRAPAAPADPQAANHPA